MRRYHSDIVRQDQSLYVRKTQHQPAPKELHSYSRIPAASTAGIRQKGKVLVPMFAPKGARKVYAEQQAAQFITQNARLSLNKIQDTEGSACKATIKSCTFFRPRYSLTSNL
jgi:hypothetical protein